MGRRLRGADRRGDAGNPDHPPAAVDHPPAQVSAYAIGDVAYSAQRVGVAENVAAYGRLPWWSAIAGLALTVFVWGAITQSSP